MPLSDNIRQEIFDCVRAERQRQIDLWGDRFDDNNTINDWVAYICEYAGKAAHSENPSELIKVAALAIAAVEAYHRNNNKFPPRHWEVDDDENTGRN
jgi:hypothetical protein